MQNLEDKQLTVLRRQFSVGIPLSAVAGFLMAKKLSVQFGMGRWAGRGLKGFALVGLPVLTSSAIVHFNRGEIFRIGTRMMREMNELRGREEGPFADAAVRAKWDAQMANRSFSMFRPEQGIAKEFESSIDFNSIVKDSFPK